MKPILRLFVPLSVHSALHAPTIKTLFVQTAMVSYFSDQEEPELL